MEKKPHHHPEPVKDFIESRCYYRRWWLIMVHDLHKGTFPTVVCGKFNSKEAVEKHFYSVFEPVYPVKIPKIVIHDAGLVPDCKAQEILEGLAECELDDVLLGLD